MYPTVPSAFVNAEGQELSLVRHGKGSDLRFAEKGDMPFDGYGYYRDGGWEVSYDVPWSKSLALEPRKPAKRVYGFQMTDADYRGGGADIATSGAKGEKVSISGDGEWSVKLRGLGKDGSYKVWLKSYTDRRWVSCEGAARGSVTFSTVRGGAVLRGDSGAVRLQVGGDSARRYYLYGKGSRRISYGKSGIKSVTKASRIKDAVTGHRHVCGLTVEAANGGSDVFLTWRIPKKAKSYRVYRRVAGKWERAALRKGRSANWWRAKGAGKAASAQRFRVRAYRDKRGRKPLGKASYAVSAAGSGSARGNVSEVTVNRRALSGKAGKARRLKAAVKTADGRRPASKKVLWFSSNSKVAEVGRTTGKVRFLKKGACKVWAKAHDGVNSMKVKVTVR